MALDKRVEKKLAELVVARKGLFVHRDSVEKFMVNYEDERDACQLSIRLECLDRVYAEFLDVQADIEKLDLPEFLVTHLSERADFETRYCTAKGFLLSKRVEDQNTTVLNTSANRTQPNPNSFHIRLPKIDMPKFNGDFSRWLSFRDTYMSMVHSNADIPTVAKLQYLLQSLEGEARKPFESVDIETDNYATVWDALLKRYDNRKFLKKQLFRTIYDLPTLKKESPNELHELVDEFQRHVRALAKLNEPTEHWDTPLVNLLSYKLDPASLRAWEEKSSQDDEVKYNDLVDFLYQRVRILQSVSSELLQRSQPVPSKVAGNYPPPKKFSTKIAANAATSEGKPNFPTCFVCSERHLLFQCPTFGKMSIHQRRELVSQRKLCWNCFRSGHHARQCSSKYTCRTCRDRHHTLLHDFSAQGKSSSTPAVTSEVSEPTPNLPLQASPQQASISNQISMSVQSYASTVLLETVALHVVDDHGKTFQARALLDSGSMSNFVSKDFAKSIATRHSKVDLSVLGIGQSMKKLKRAITTTIKSRTNSFATKLQFLVIDDPTANLPTVPVNLSSWKLPNVQLADPTFHTPSKIDLVIGGETYWELHTGKKLSLGPGQPQVIETLFGWTLCGPISQGSSDSTVCHLSKIDNSLDATIQRFWEMETIPTQSVHTSSEQICEELYAATTSRDPSGRYVVRLPKTDDPEIVLGDSREIAERRFLSIERRLERDSNVKTAYHSFMEEYERLGHMKRLADPVDCTNPHSYLPHHPVFKMSSTTTKTRVVFDASCKTASGHSLNDLLLVGPVVQDDLLSLVLRFRTHAIAMVGDIEKMYRQIQVHPEDQPLQRILWRTDPSEPIATYQLQTVTYGTASAPYLATKTLQQIAKDAEHRFPQAAGPVSNDFYVDDFMSGAKDIRSAIRIRREVTAMLASAGFPIKKWASNSTEVLQDVPPEDQAIQPWHDLQDPQSVSTLGLIWEPGTDILRFKVQLPLPAPVLTKRRIMSYIAQIFDPLGLVGPTVTKAKLFMQYLWTLMTTDDERYDWDQPLPPRIQQAWKEFHTTIDLLRQVKVPRFVSLAGATKFELHFFADASEKAYGTCCYVRAESSHGITVQLLVSKSKLSPIAARHTIARLELCAAHLLTQLYQKVVAALKFSPPTYFWSDSTTALQWIQSSPARWKTFVANRVTQIQSTTSINSWRHVPGCDNPADDISRGLNPSELLENPRWWNGPSWLSLPPEQWPTGTPPTAEPPATSQESRKTPLVMMTAIQNSFCDQLFSKFSQFSKLRRMLAYWLRYLQKLRDRSLARNTTPLTLKPKNNATIVPLDTDELQSAERVLYRLAQRQTFQEEYNDLKAGSQVSKSSLLKLLNPELDRFGIIRVGGRLRHAEVPEAARHPIVLSAKHPLSSLLTSHYHKTLLHAGPQLMLATLRQSYWILGARNLARHTYHQCQTCFLSKPKLIQQSTADLPSSRVTPTRPFSVCGVDYCGPFYIKSPVRNRGPTKAYVAIFICFSTRAVHIQLVSDLTTASYLGAVRRVVARYGMIKELHSDNATTFKGASNELHRLYQMVKKEGKERNQILNWCANKGITFKFIPPRAPHFGGLWEAAVKSAKTHLLKEVGCTNLLYEQLLTLLAEVEMCLNSRPLTPLPTEPSDLEVLTPAHFVLGYSLQAVPEPDLTKVPENRLTLWELTQRRFQQIWARWYPEYLSQLQSRAMKGCNPPVNIEVGRVVVIKDDNLPPVQWPLGRITKLHPGKDGIVRVVTLKTASADNVVRPVARIALLPTQNDPQPTPTIEDQ